ncbi:DNA polymerase beta [Acidithiobacillus marinus]|uniref:DNA polymerase beta n=1 Tax=Acidithiobacillus marinus TaxID=187490 RepID=A0A2I1DJY8_9PROT|nr:nucleotidyltransferase domain-containing protein [Acidithiobacillus marinus]PKY10191.1 DNA polymerase beta [Acidithiobacillus marinus]
MRLSPEQVAIIRQAAQESFGPEARIWLFGSRVDDSKRGGDIDLLIQVDKLSAENGLMAKIRFLGKLEKTLGERKIDVVIENPGDTRPIVRVAHHTGVRL